jgi:type II secretory pathway pseudopilin PulG
MSLVEATIILLVLMLLTGVLAPSIGDYVNDAKMVKVKEDCEAIGVSVMRLRRDIGSCLKFDGRDRCTKWNRVDVLYSEGPRVETEMLEADATAPFFNDNIFQTLNWDAEKMRGDSLEHQLVDNGSGPNYKTPKDTTPTGYTLTGPQFNLGWRGAYLSSPIGADPWGRRYLVNSVFFATAQDALEGTEEGKRSGGWSHDVICLSAGVNQLYETSFADKRDGRGTERGGDDFTYVIHGDTR